MHVTTLPHALRSSPVPWVPGASDQAPALRPGDRWTASLGRWSLKLYVHLEDGRAIFYLRLRDSVSREDLGGWECATLQEAASTAKGAWTTLNALVAAEFVSQSV